MIKTTNQESLEASDLIWLKRTNATKILVIYAANTKKMKKLNVNTYVK
ncbi:hypothetical protein ACLRE7_00145 [Mycoplasmopsis meleagridis]